MTRRITWRGWFDDTRQKILAQLSRGTADEIARKIQDASIIDGITMTALGNKISAAVVEAADAGRDPMARRDDRYRTILLKEIAMQLASFNGDAVNANTRLKNFETMIYSQPLPEHGTWVNQR